MLYPKLTNYPSCVEIPTLLDNIDCKLSQLGSDLYNNTIYMLNRPVSTLEMSTLLNYKRILMIKYCNPYYSPYYTIEMIASRVKRLTLNCKSRCLYEEITTTTTTTTTIPVTTTTTTTIPI